MVLLQQGARRTRPRLRLVIQARLHARSNVSAATREHIRRCDMCSENYGLGTEASTIMPWNLGSNAGPAMNNYGFPAESSVTNNEFSFLTYVGAFFAHVLRRKALTTFSCSSTASFLKIWMICPSLGLPKIRSPLGTMECKFSLSSNNYNKMQVSSHNQYSPRQITPPSPTRRQTGRVRQSRLTMWQTQMQSRTSHGRFYLRPRRRNASCSLLLIKGLDRQMSALTA